MRVMNPVVAVWIELAVWLSIGAFFYAYSVDFAGERGSFEFGPAAWPRAVVMLMITAALVQFALKVNRLRGPALKAAERRAEREAAGWPDAARTLGMMAIPIAYVYVMPYVGFYVATPIFLVAYLAYLGERDWRRLLGVPLFVYVLVNLVFTKLFFVALPVGSLPVFYDISNWFLVTLR